MKESRDGAGINWRLLETGGLLVSLIALVWGVQRVLINNLTWFDYGHDFLSYQLPFGIKIFDPKIIRIAPHLEELFTGSPLLINLLIGLAWKLTPIIPINGTHMIGIGLWLLSLPVLYLVLRRYLITYALFCLAVPLLLIHTMSGYIDLAANVFLFLAIVSMFQLTSRSHPPGPWVTLGLVALAATGAAKYTVLPLAIAGGIIFAVLVATHQDLSRRAKRLAILLVLILAPAWAFRNLLIHHNPIYPLKPPVISRFVPYTWSMEEDSNNWPAELVGWPQPLVTLASLLEVSAPEAKGQGQPRYSVDQWGNGPGTPGYRMGGFWWPLVVFSLAVLGHSLRRQLVRGKELAPFVVLACCSLFLPHSHELRYSLYIPMTLGFLVAIVCKRMPPGLTRGAVLLTTLVLALISWRINWQHLERHSRTLGQLAAEKGLHWEQIPRADVYCGSKVGRDLVLLTGPTLHENQVRWVGPGEPCPTGGLTFFGNYEW